MSLKVSIACVWTCVSRPPSIIQPLLVCPCTHDDYFISPHTHTHTHTHTPQLLSSESFLLFSRTLKYCYLLFQSCRPDLKLQLEVNQLHPLTTCTEPKGKIISQLFSLSMYTSSICFWSLWTRTGIYLRFWVQRQVHIVTTRSSTDCTCSYKPQNAWSEMIPDNGIKWA